MRIGFIGAGNMASALARGLGEPVVCSDVDAARAQALAAELGGQAVASNAEVVAASDLVVLCHKPKQLEQVAADIDAGDTIVVSLLGGVALAAVRAAYPGAASTGSCPTPPWRSAAASSASSTTTPAIRRRSPRSRSSSARPARSSCCRRRSSARSPASRASGPAYAALVAEAQIDAAVRAGIPAPVAARLVGASMAGSAALLQARDMDTLGVRRAVTSPGGVTAHGLAALEAGGIRAAFDDAMDAVLEAGA